MFKNQRILRMLEAANQINSTQHENDCQQNEFIQNPENLNISNIDYEIPEFLEPSTSCNEYNIVTMQNVSPVPLVDLSEDLYLTDSGDECTLASSESSINILYPKKRKRLRSLETEVEVQQQINSHVQDNLCNVSMTEIEVQQLIHCHVQENLNNNSTTEVEVQQQINCHVQDNVRNVSITEVEVQQQIHCHVQEKLNNNSTTEVEVQQQLHCHVQENLNNVSTIESLIPGSQNRKRKRKGQSDPKEWKKNLRKMRRQKGEPYLSSKGVLKPGKKICESKCKDICKKKCNENFREDERLKIFSNFWNIETMEQKRQYIISLIERQQPQTRRTANLDSKRKFTNNYYLIKQNSTDKIKVCQKFFLTTFNITETFVRFCFKKLSETNVIDIDRRGRHTPANKKDEEMKQFIRDHIKSFPRMPSHYVRKDTKKEYLDQELNLTKMYELYKAKCEEEQINPAHISYYRTVFKKEFNIGFHSPRKDMCDKCFTYMNMSETDKENRKDCHEEHLKRKVIAREHRDQGKLLSESGKIHFVEYDVEAICNCPSSSSKMIYYKRRIAVYNFTLLDFKPKKRDIYCFCWHEGIGKKGAIEIGFCLYKYLQEKQDGKEITFMSDTCASQCRNMYISALLLYCIETLNIPVINQKYFEPGHSQMEADNIHATIEQAKKNIPVFHPSGYYTIIRAASRRNPFKVFEMDNKEFIDIKELKKTIIKNNKIDTYGEPVNWLNIRWLQYRKDDNKHIYFKYNLDDKEFKNIKVIRRGKRCAINAIVLKRAYQGPVPIPQEKFNDLQDLCKAGIIPDQYHDFYNNFLVKDSISGDSDED